MGSWVTALETIKIDPGSLRLSEENRYDIQGPRRTRQIPSEKCDEEFVSEPTTRSIYYLATCYLATHVLPTVKH